MREESIQKLETCSACCRFSFSGYFWCKPGRMASILRGFFGSQRANTRCVAAPWFNDLHLLPVVGEFLAAIETDHVGARQSGGLIAPCARTNRDRKTVMAMPTTEQRIYQFRHHTQPSQNPNRTCHAIVRPIQLWSI